MCFARAPGSTHQLMLRVGCAGVLQGTGTPALSDKRQKTTMPAQHFHHGTALTMSLFYGRLSPGGNANTCRYSRAGRLSMRMHADHGLEHMLHEHTALAADVVHMHLAAPSLAANCTYRQISHPPSLTNGGCLLILNLLHTGRSEQYVSLACL